MKKERKKERNARKKERNNEVKERKERKVKCKKKIKFHPFQRSKITLFTINTSTHVK